MLSADSGVIDLWISLSLVVVNVLGKMSDGCMQHLSMAWKTEPSEMVGGWCEGIKAKADRYVLCCKYHYQAVFILL